MTDEEQLDEGAKTTPRLNRKGELILSEQNTASLAADSI